EHSKVHRNRVNLEDFMRAWQAFGQLNVRQHILTSAMRGSTPEQAGEEEFLAKVGHPAEVQAFELAMPQLLAFLRKELSNDFLTLRVEIDPERVVTKQLPPQEFLKECIEKNPALGDLLRNIDAELG
ncbi:MAG: hypothetical protein K2G85_08705, partial [Muribaculaceae bacterium]|nr:hypothetical protein [Muribaculaceae bacterium]